MTRSSKPQRRSLRCLHPPRLWHPLPARMAAHPPFLCVILVLRLSRCHSMAHHQGRRASRHRRTVPLKVILAHVCKAKPPKVTRANLLPDSLVKVCLTWGSRAVHLRHSRLSRLVEGSSVWFHSLESIAEYPIFHVSFVAPCSLRLTLTFFFFVRMIVCCLIVVITPCGGVRRCLSSLFPWWFVVFDSYR